MRDNLEHQSASKR